MRILTYLSKVTRKVSRQNMIKDVLLIDELVVFGCQMPQQLILDLFFDVVVGAYTRWKIGCVGLRWISYHEYWCCMVIRMRWLRLDSILFICCLLAVRLQVIIW